MKRCCIALLPLLTVLGISLHAGTLFRSNSVGIQGPRLTGNEDERPEYVLDVTIDGARETRALLRDGEVVRSTEIVRDGSTIEERVFEDGVIQRETTKRNDGTVVAEDLYSNGSLAERSRFTYRDGRLVSRLVENGDGQALYNERYSYWHDGTLRTIVKEDQSQIRTEYRYQDGRLEEEWVSRGDDSERFEFDAQGRLVIRELYQASQLVEQEVRLYWGADTGSLLKEVVISRGQTITRRLYDERGRLVRDADEIDSQVVRVLTRTYEEDLLVAESEIEDGVTKDWEYEYNEEGARAVERYLENGELVEVTYLILEETERPADRMTELYNRGVAVLRIYYEGRTRLREDVLRDGEVIRTRTFGDRQASGAGSDS